jgi:hypothetical protein
VVSSSDSICTIDTLRYLTLISNQIEGRSDSQLVSWLRRPCDLGRHSKQAVVVVVHAVQIEPHDRLGKGLEGRQVQKLRAAERLNPDPAGEFPVVVPLIISADIADDIRIDRRERRVYGDSCVLLASGQDRGGITRAAKGRKRTSCCPTDLRAGPAPIPRQQFVEFLDGMFGDAGQDVGEPGLRIDVVHLGGDDQAVHHGGALAAAI